MTIKCLNELTLLGQLLTIFIEGVWWNNYRFAKSEENKPTYAIRTFCVLFSLNTSHCVIACPALYTAFFAETCLYLVIHCTGCMMMFLCVAFESLFIVCFSRAIRQSVSYLM